LRRHVASREHQIGCAVRRTGDARTRQGGVIEMAAFDKARYGIDSYQDWLKSEGLRVVEGLAIDCNTVETADWPRLGARAAALHLDGRGDFCNMILCELAPGKSTAPQRHLFEEVI